MCITINSVVSMHLRLMLAPSKLYYHSRFYCSSSSSKTSRQSVFCGIKPNGPMHLGNYFAIFNNCVITKNSNIEVLCSVNDMLTITSSDRLLPLSDNILQITACLIGCGLKPTENVIFLQSQIPYHSQLCWVLGCYTDLTELPKDKSDASIGKYLLPISQATDLLLYSSNFCIDYNDSIQLQLARNLAAKFNKEFGETFQVPRPVCNVGPILRNLRKPVEKMSKFDIDDRGRISLIDPPDVIFSKIKKSVTDMTSRVTYEPAERPGVSNLVAIHSAVTGKSTEELCQEAVDMNTGMYKLLVAEVLIEAVKPIQNRINDLLTDKVYLTSVLSDGAEKALNYATRTWLSVREKIGTQIV